MQTNFEIIIGLMALAGSITIAALAAWVEKRLDNNQSPQKERRKHE
ncbi:MAG: hypothetical protein IH598_00685 [Bacteroidales bacterium]|nr:hypothetical protein [Bacteroidales bacterium]